MLSDELLNSFNYARTDRRIRDLLEYLIRDDICVNMLPPDVVLPNNNRVPADLPAEVQTYLKQCIWTLERFPAPSPREQAWSAWEADLTRLLKLCRDDACDSNRFERLVLATSVPRFCHLPEWLKSVGPFRRELHARATAHLAESWTRARIATDAGCLRVGAATPNWDVRRRRWEVDVIDSYSTTFMLRDELHHYGLKLERALKYDLEIDPLAQRPLRPLASLEFLSALLELRMLLDVQRWSLLRLGAGLEPDFYKNRAKLLRTDAQLRVAFTRIVQRNPLYVGAIPNLADHQYGRTEHFAQRLLIERYHEIFFPAAEPPRRPDEESRLHGVPPLPPRNAVWCASEYTVESIPASSAMALLYDVLFLISPGRQLETRVVCIDEAIYFETKRLAPLAKPAHNKRRDSEDNPPLTGRVVLSLIPANRLPRLPDKCDVLLLEPIGNRPNGEVIDLGSVLVARRKGSSPKTIILDKTLDPFCVDTLIPLLPEDVLLIVIESLSKYWQLGSNLSIGGIASVIAKGSAAQGRAHHLGARLQKLIEALGQHMDPRLVVAMPPDRRALEARLARMRRNARLLAHWLRRHKQGKVRHADAEHTCSTLVYLSWSIPPAGRSELDFKGALESRGSPLRGTAEWYAAYGDAVFAYLEKWIGADYLLSPVRLGTSFGFSRTSIDPVPSASTGEFQLRVSAGVENIEALREIYAVLGEVLSREGRSGTARKGEP